jgi:hypothetical protein
LLTNVRLDGKISSKISIKDYFSAEKVSKKQKFYKIDIRSIASERRVKVTARKSYNISLENKTFPKI